MDSQSRRYLGFLVVLFGAFAPVAANCAKAERPVQRIVTAPVRKMLGSAPELRVVALVNAERQRRGLPTVTPNESLMNFSRSWSQTQASRRRMYHSKGPYRENVAVGQRTPEEVMSAWLNSPGHRRNILSSGISQIGVGCVASSNGGLYWTQTFQ
jgi:uncharacterized protein YkwD